MYKNNLKRCFYFFPTSNGESHSVWSNRRKSSPAFQHFNSSSSSSHGKRSKRNVIDSVRNQLLSLPRSCSRKLSDRWAEKQPFPVKYCRFCCKSGDVKLGRTWMKERSQPRVGSAAHSSPGGPSCLLIRPQAPDTNKPRPASTAWPNHAISPRIGQKL